MNTTLETPPRNAIRRAPREEVARCMATLARAFRDDPAFRWMYPDEAQYTRYFPPFAEAFGGGAFALGTAHRTGGHQAVALWLPPGAHPDEERLAAILEQSLAPELRADAFALFDQMATFHPAEPHWHLTLVGTDPSCRGKGLGTALIQRTLAQCDRIGQPAYLEATNASNARLYERLGFKPVGQIQAGSSPTITPMVRPPQPAGDRRVRPTG